MTRIAFGTDERTGVTEAVVAGLRARGHEVDVLAANKLATLAWSQKRVA